MMKLLLKNMPLSLGAKEIASTYFRMLRTLQWTFGFKRYLFRC